MMGSLVIVGLVWSFLDMSTRGDDTKDELEGTEPGAPIGSSALRQRRLPNSDD
jgi:hypothetical protein